MTDDILLQIIPGDVNTRARNLNRLPGIQDNIEAVRSEFIGMPEVCHAIVEQIIYLRRDPHNREHQQTFRQLLFDYSDTLLEHLNVRWLLSICDTFVDIGNPVESAVAMNIVQCINRCNLDQTLLLNAKDGTLNSQRLAQELKVPTWGGMITADVPNGDMIYNMMTRLERVVGQDEQLNKIWCRIKELSRSEKNVIMNQVCLRSRHPAQRKLCR